MNLQSLLYFLIYYSVVPFVQNLYNIIFMWLTNVKIQLKRLKRLICVHSHGLFIFTYIFLYSWKMQSNVINLHAYAFILYSCFIKKNNILIDFFVQCDVSDLQWNMGNDAAVAFLKKFSPCWKKAFTLIQCNGIIYNEKWIATFSFLPFIYLRYTGLQIYMRDIIHTHTQSICQRSLLKS